MKRILCLLLCLTLFAPTALAENAALDEQADKLFRAYSTVGGALVVARHGEIVYEHYYGFANRKDQEAVDQDTYFRIASVTKLVSAIGMMQLVEEGLLDLDADISEYLGYPASNPHFPDDPITLRTLMTHTSTLKAEGNFSHTGHTLSFLISENKRRNGDFLKSRPGSVYAYSNFGAGVMGALAEAVTAEELNTHFIDRLFAPLGIDAAFNPNLLSAPDRIAAIYNRDGSLYTSRRKLLEDPWSPEPDPQTHYRMTIGSLWIRPVDLARLGILLCGGGTLDGTAILQPETVAEMMSSQQGKGVITCDPPYGLCVDRVTGLLPDRMVYGHQGLMGDGLCSLYFEPESGLVFMLVTNGCNTGMNNHIAKMSRRFFDFAWTNFAQ